MENLNDLSLPDLKNLCKKHGVSVVGDKKSLIKNLKYFLEPVEGVLNTHPGRKLPEGKKIVGVKEGSKDTTNLILKNKGSFLYYSMGYKYYLIDKHLEI